MRLIPRGPESARDGICLQPTPWPGDILSPMSTDNSMGPPSGDRKASSSKPPPLPPFAAPPPLANYAYTSPPLRALPAKNRKLLIIALSLAVLLIAGIAIVIGPAADGQGG